MAALTPAPDTTGKGLFEGTTSWRSRDDLPDRKSGGVYSHSVYEFSATEANEWVGFMQYVRQVAKSGAVALKCRNETGGSLAAGPVRVVGYNASEDVFLVGLADADGNTPADFLLLTALSNNTNGTAYIGGDFSFNTAGRTVGDPCYLSDSGTVTFTAPNGADQIVQEIGRVKVVNASGTIAGCVQVPTKVGSSYLQSGGGGGISDGDKGDITVSSSGSVWTIDNGVVSLAKMADLATDRLIGRDTAGTGAPEALTVGGGIEFTGSGGIQRSALTGDVTASAGSNTTTIPAGTVTYSKMQDVSATDRLLGRDTAGSGDVEELTVGGGVEFTGSGGIQRSALTGDVTASAGSNATTIANDAVTAAKILDGNVTYGKIQDTSAASVLLGRGSAAGAGDVQEITLGAGMNLAGTILSTVTTVDNGSITNAKLADMVARTIKGRAANSTGVPGDIALSPGKFIGDRDDTAGAFYPSQTVSKTANYTLVQDDYGVLLLADATSGTLTVTLPSPASVGSGWCCTVKKSDTSANRVNVAANSSELIEGTNTARCLLNKGQFQTLLTDGTNWHVIGEGGVPDAKLVVKLVSTVDSTLASAYEAGDTVDGVVLAAGDRILLTRQAGSGFVDNGIYVVQASGAPVRADDFDTSSDIMCGTRIAVTHGTDYAGSVWRVLTAQPAIGSSLTFSLDFLSSGLLYILGSNNGGTSPTQNMIFGQNNLTTNTSGSGNVVIGTNQNLRTASSSNIGVFTGSGTSGLNTIYFGKGELSTSASNVSICGTGGSGSNNAGGSLSLTGGTGTGSAKGGNLLLRTSPSLASGSTQQTLYDRYICVAQAQTLTDAVATTVATWTLSSGSTGGGIIQATIRVTDGTDFQSMTQTVEVALVNKAGTYTTNITATTGAKAVSAGTLTATWTVTAAGAVQLTADTSLVPSGTNGFVVYYSIINNSQSNVTLP
jgi:hypothetical protein